MTLIEKNSQKIVIFIFVLGVILSYFRASNFSDADAYSVILSFTNLYDNGFYNPSRGAYGHPIPELIIGAINFFFGSRFANIFCFVLFYISIYLIYYTFLNKHKNSNLFALLVFSNSFLFFENTSAIDYSIAFFLFSLGLFYFFKHFFYLASIIFGLTIASRANFLLFIYPIIFIFFFYNWKKFDTFLIIKVLSLITFVGLIFYIPLFYVNNFTLDFLDLPFLDLDNTYNDNDSNNKWYGGPPMNIENLLPRFLYKIYLLVGIYSSIVIFFYLKNFLKTKIILEENMYFFTIIFINLLIFYFMPTKISIIHMFILFFYILIFKFFNIKQLCIIILLNFLQWFFVYSVADIEYKNHDKCAAVEAVSVSFNFSLKKGVFFEYFDTEQNMTECYAKHMGKYSQKFIKGFPLKD